MSPCRCALCLSLCQVQLLENTLLDWHNRTLRNDYRHAQPLRGRVVEASFRAQRGQGRARGPGGDKHPRGRCDTASPCGWMGWNPRLGGQCPCSGGVPCASSLFKGCASPAFECHTSRVAGATWQLRCGWCMERVGTALLGSHAEERSCILKHGFCCS